MRVVSAGEHIEFTSHHSWIAGVLLEGVANQLVESQRASPDIRVTVQQSDQAFNTSGWEVLTRDSWRRANQIVVRNACSSGLDLLISVVGSTLDINARWRPDLKVRGASTLLRARARLLIRAVLLQFPALWWSQQRGRSPLHASVCTIGPDGPAVLIAGPGGIGKSTLINHELVRGARSTSDNLCVSDGFTAWGLLEPRRIPVATSQPASGRKMPHGRREAPWPNRVDDLVPDMVLVLRRDASTTSSATPCESRDASRFLTAGTYMAGELRRYWSFAATLALGTGMGEIHPPVERVANALSSNLPCFDVVLGEQRQLSLEELLPARPVGG